jgi:hypothetical protein
MIGNFSAAVVDFASQSISARENPDGAQGQLRSSRTGGSARQTAEAERAGMAAAEIMQACIMPVLAHGKTKLLPWPDQGTCLPSLAKSALIGRWFCVMSASEALVQLMIEPLQGLKQHQ